MTTSTALTPALTPALTSAIDDAIDDRQLAGAAIRDIGALAPGVVPFGVTLGVTAGAMHVSGPSVTLGAFLVFGGSAQLTTMSLLHLGSGLAAALVSGAVVNARVMLYGAALAPRFQGQPLWFRLLAPQFIQDQTYLSAMGRPHWTGAVFRRYWGWLGGTLLVTWTGSVLLGVLAGPLLPPLPHLSLVGTALFVAMLVPKLVDRTTALTACAAGAAAVLVGQLAPALGILAGTAAGLLVALAADRGRTS